MATRARHSWMIGAAFAVLACPLAAAPQGEGAAPTREQTEAYLRAAGSHYGVPEAEMRVIARHGSAPEDAVVVVHLAHLTGVSPDVLLARRNESIGWWELGRHYGIDATSYYVPLETTSIQGSLTEVYAAFRDRPRSEWSGIQLHDDVLSILVQVRFLSRYVDVSPDRVLAAYRDTGSFVLVYPRLLRGALGRLRVSGGR